MSDKSERIRDIQSIKEIGGLLDSFTKFKRVFPALKPGLQKLGVDVESAEAAFDELEGMKEDYEALASLPDEFNGLFADRGWIMYGTMNADVAQLAVKLARSGKIDEAEQELVDYYDTETVDWHLTRLKVGVEAFVPRWKLAKKALEDYAEGRFHACVPVVLALMDGLVQQVHVDVHGEGRNLSSEEVNLEAWDSIAAHKKGLGILRGVIMSGGRFKTRTDPLEIPYRNGIMHGMDLGYDNRLVAAKCWAALFAIGEWARKAERGELEAPEETEAVGVSEAIEDLVETQERTQQIRKRGEEWTPRELAIGEDIPAAGEIEAYAEGTPERAIVEFLNLWKVENYGYMASFLKGVGGAEKDPGRVREEFEIFRLEEFELIDIQDVSMVFTDVEVRLEIHQFDEEVTKTTDVRLTYMDEDGEPAILTDGEWILTNHIKLLAPS